ncbi:hypothetical protein LCGC14_0845270 [marine sediment metagenome]|uniref:Uncharacterized protein n=1 Tax=marine sediment metagenome TaxID=412755 RepID=A0A0F9PX58_9ZZZZ
MNTIEFTKDDTRATRWLLDGVSTDIYRPGFHGIHVEDDEVSVSTDGAQIRATSTPQPLAELGGKAIVFAKPPRVNGDSVKCSVTESKLPDWRSSVQPKAEPKFSITLDGEILASLVKDMGFVRLDFHGKFLPIEIHSADKYALLMPCGDNPTENFTP